MDLSLGMNKNADLFLFQNNVMVNIIVQLSDKCYQIQYSYHKLPQDLYQHIK